MTFVQRWEGETIDQLLRRFKTGVDKSGVLREFRQHQRFKSAAELRKLKAQAAQRRRMTRTRHRSPAWDR